MVFEIGINLRVTECFNKGDRDYMEDFSHSYFESIHGRIAFGFFAIFDGHGGSEAALFAKTSLMTEIMKRPLFWSEDDQDVMMAMKQGFLNTHELMWAERCQWEKAANGLESTAGTTVTAVIIRNRKLYLGHVGDSVCILGVSKVNHSRIDLWEAINLTVEHKPSNLIERQRIEDSGGSLLKASGVVRVAWKRPRIIMTDQDTVEGDVIDYEEVPFLAVTRSLGDLWSYDFEKKVYHVSPEPDLQCVSVDSMEHRCIILASDGLWNVVSKNAAVEIVRICERESERRAFLDPRVGSNFSYNPAATLVKYALTQWKHRKVKADNISVIVIMVDPPGPSMAIRREDRRSHNFSELNIEKTFVNHPPSFEGFTEMWTEELLVECSGWKSANDLGGLIKFAIQEADPENTIEDNNFVQTISNSNLEKSYEGVVKSQIMTTKSKTMSICNDLKMALISDSNYSTFCLSWINNSKVWNFLSSYFIENGLLTEYETMKYIATVDVSLARGILRIMPWIHGVKKTFRKDLQIHTSLKLIPLFCNFWLNLYRKIIKPLEKRNKNNNMRSALLIMKPQIVRVLKESGFLLSKNMTSRTLKEFHRNGNNLNEQIPILCKRLQRLPSEITYRDYPHSYKEAEHLPANLSKKLNLDKRESKVEIKV